MTCHGTTHYAEPEKQKKPRLTKKEQYCPELQSDADLLTNLCISARPHGVYDSLGKLVYIDLCEECDCRCGYGEEAMRRFGANRFRLDNGRPVGIGDLTRQMPNAVARPRDMCGMTPGTVIVPITQGTPGERMHFAREKNGLSLKQAAKMIDTDFTTISAFEHNHKGKNLNFMAFVKLCRMYGISTNWVLTGNLEPGPIDYCDSLIPGWVPRKDGRVRLPDYTKRTWDTINERTVLVRILCGMTAHDCAEYLAEKTGVHVSEWYLHQAEAGRPDWLISKLRLYEEAFGIPRSYYLTGRVKG